MSVDIRIGPGNLGAVGINWRGAQGTSVEDVTVYAGDGAIGIAGLGGSGGAHSNVTVIGGRFGIDGRQVSPEKSYMCHVVVTWEPPVAFCRLSQDPRSHQLSLSMHPALEFFTAASEALPLSGLSSWSLHLHTAL